jgi:hypothetical protein
VIENKDFDAFDMAERKEIKKMKISGNKYLRAIIATSGNAILNDLKRL